MLRLVMTKTGAPVDAVRVEQVADPPPPGPHEAQAELVASPIHPADLLIIQGLYVAATGTLPKPLGLEGVGRITAVGELVKHLKPGDLTPIGLAGGGVWQERLNLPAEFLVALPPGGDPLQYALAFANPATALLMLRDIVPVAMGEWVIQNAANSSVGVSLIQLAKKRGIRTVNVVRREGLEGKLHDLGADVVLVDGPDLAKRVAAATGKAAVKLAIDAVSGAAAARLAECLAPGGTLCNYGMLSGKNLEVSPGVLIGGEVVVRGFWLTAAMKKLGRKGNAELLAELIPMVASGALKIEVERTYRLDEAHEALEHAGRGERSGKILFVGGK